MAGASCCGSTTPTWSAAARSMSRRSSPISTGSASSRTPWCASRERFALYEREFERLRAAGRVYACYETPEELELRRKVLLGRGLPPVYERKPEGAPVPEGVAPHWRFKLDHDAPIEWDDLVRGHQKFDPALISDPVIRRADGSWLYLLPSVIDDIDLGDHPHRPRRGPCVEQRGAAADVRRAGRRAAASSPMRRCWSRRRASCRSGSARPASSAARGGDRADGAAVAARPARHVAAGRGRRPASPSWPKGFDFRHLRPRAGAFRSARSRAAQRQAAPPLDYADVADRLPEGIGEAEWLVLRGNLAHLGEAADWLPVLHCDDRRRRKSCQTTSRCWPRRPRSPRPSTGRDDPGTR